ncbi:MAG TPA: Wzz/FepE/Etk N-terminal domain-containing protein [Terrimicrobiaceae bacterium]
MPQPKPATPQGLNVHNILYVLFKHKWKILLSSAIGIGASIAVYLTSPTTYETQAKLLVRYVVDRSSVDKIDSTSPINSNDQSLINSEVEILTSWDLATEVAKAVNLERPESQSGSEDPVSPMSIRFGLSVAALRGTNIIVVSYRNKDPRLTTLVLKELLNRYFTKHLEIHRSADAFAYVSQQSDEVRARLSRTEDELKILKDKAGITSFQDSSANARAELASMKQQLQTVQTEYSEQKAVIHELEKAVNVYDAKQVAEASPGAPGGQNYAAVQQYQALLERLRQLREIELGLLSRYAQNPQQRDSIAELQRARQIRGQSPAETSRLPETSFVGVERDMAQAIAREKYRQQNDTGFAYRAGKKSFDALVKEAEKEILQGKNKEALQAKESESELLKLNQEQIANLEKQRADLEARFPGIATTLPNLSPENLKLDPAAAEQTRVEGDRARVLSERIRLVGMEAKIAALKSHLAEVQEHSQKLAEIGPRLEELERTREIQDANYKYFQASLEKARIDEVLDPSKMPNISVVQSPSIALQTTRDLKKIILGLAGGGILAGLAFAFLIEFVLDRSVRRPAEVETLLGFSPLLSIPYLNGHRYLRLRWPLAKRRSHTASKADYLKNAPWHEKHFIRPYSEAIRDRLVLYFELNQMNHKPKLVAVAGCSANAGSSTLAAGIAAALSETGDGKVLLVDMNVGRPEIHPFFRGTPACSLTEALVGEPAPAGENLYLATATPPDAEAAQLAPRKFYNLMPHLKASAFDYIIFDMPPFTQTSITLPMSRFMDKVVLVAEAEKSSREVLKLAHRDLSSVGATMFVILNKVRLYIPRWAGAES